VRKRHTCEIEGERELRLGDQEIKKKMTGIRKKFTAMKKAKDDRLICTKNERIFYWYNPEDDTWAIVRTKPKYDEFPDVGERILVKSYTSHQFIGYARITRFLTSVYPSTTSALVEMDVLSDPVSLM